MPAFHSRACVDLRPTKTQQLSDHYLESMFYAKSTSRVAGFTYARFCFSYTTLCCLACGVQTNCRASGASFNQYFQSAYQHTAGFDMMDGVRRW